jgi:molybdopterin synthase sulfur carrier subunit
LVSLPIGGLGAAAAVERNQMVKIVYFAWVRERVGKAEEMLDIPADVVTVADLVVWLRSRGPEYIAAFAKPEVVRAALDQNHVKATAKIAGAREIAFFPPVTGG